MLIDPVGHQAPDHAALVPVGLALLVEPGLRCVPFVADLVVVEDHRGGQRREHPAHDRIGPDVAVADRVLLEVLERFGRCVRVNLSRADGLTHVLRRLVGVELVAEHHHGVGPERLRLPQHPQPEGVQRIDPAALRMPPALEGVRGPVRRRGPARAEQQAQVAVGGNRPDARMRELVALRRPGALAVQVDLVGMGPPGLETGDRDEGEMVTLDREGGRLRAQDLDLARLVRLDPDGRLALADEAQHRAHDHFSHVLHHARFRPAYAASSPPHVGSRRSRPLRLNDARTSISCGPAPAGTVRTVEFSPRGSRQP